METPSIMQLMNKEVLHQLDSLLKPFMAEYDMIIMMDMLHGNRFKEGKTQMIIKIGSGRRLNRKFPDPPLEPVFYDELIIEMRATSKSFNFSAFIFYNEQNKTEGYSYSINPELDINDVFIETIVLPAGNNGRRPELFFADLEKLIKLNRDIRIEGRIGSDRKSD